MVFGCIWCCDGLQYVVIKESICSLLCDDYESRINEFIVAMLKKYALEYYNIVFNSDDDITVGDEK